MVSMNPAGLFTVQTTRAAPVTVDLTLASTILSEFNCVLSLPEHAYSVRSKRVCAP